MKNKILGTIGVFWGGAIIVSRVLSGAPQGEGAYVAGQNTALIFGAVLLLVGLYTLLKKKK